MTVMTSVANNHLMERLEPEVKAHIQGKLKTVKLKAGTSLYETGKRIEFVYFPADSIVSLVNIMEDGTSVETALVGNDGLVGVAALLGGMGHSETAIVQSSGLAFRLPAGELVSLFNRHPNLREVILAFTLSLMNQIAQTSACYRYHSIEQQLCRWILSTLDRLPTKTLSITHELIAAMLGVRRESVTEAIGSLQREGGIECGRGRITVRDRSLVDSLACECYQELKRLSP